MKTKRRLTLLQAQALLAAALVALVLAVKFLAPELLTTLRTQYHESVRATPPFSLDDVREIVRPAKDALLRFFGEVG